MSRLQGDRFLLFIMQVVMEKSSGIPFTDFLFRRLCSRLFAHWNLQGEINKWRNVTEVEECASWDSQNNIPCFCIV